jgi:hypothetical protein
MDMKKMEQAKKYMQMAMDCLSGEHEPKDKEESEDVAPDESEKPSSSSDGVDSGRSMFRQRLGKYA